jgi:hypothetical protein
MTTASDPRVRWYDDDGVTHLPYGDGVTLYADAWCRRWRDEDTYECIGRIAPAGTPRVTCVWCVAFISRSKR